MMFARRLKSFFSAPQEKPVDPQLENFVWLLNRMPEGVAPPLVRSEAEGSYQDIGLVERVAASYKKASTEFRASGDGWWDTALFDIKRDVHNALVSNDTNAAASVLRNPAASTFFWGFDAISSSPAGEPEPHELVLRRLNKSIHWHDLYALWLCDGLLSLAEAVGGRRASYPEIDMDPTLPGRGNTYDVDAILDSIEAAIGVELRFPNPYPDELGLLSKRGIIGFRSIQSLYQAWRISQFANGNPGFKVLEIGAGLGRTAYFSSLFGVKNYTIVDIPLTNAAQGYFLGRVLGGDQVSLYGEEIGEGVRVLPSTVMSEHNEKYDLVVNVDSWTEMPLDIALMYWKFARTATSAVLSINHEYNPNPVRELYRPDAAVRVLRYPYPMRRGYIEEILTW